MTFEAPTHIPEGEDEAHFEKMPADSMESLSGPLAEGFRMCFDSKQMKDFIQDVFERNGVELLQVQYIPDEDVTRVIAISADYFDLKGDQQVMRAKEIADLIKSIATSRMEEARELE